jgi:CBS domain-containing protein
VNVLTLCERALVGIQAQATLREAARAMRAHHVGALAVTDPSEPGRVVGIVTDRDLVVGPLAGDADIDAQTVETWCHAQLVCISRTASTQDAVRAMQHAGVRRIFVTDTHGAVLGMVSMDDLLQSVAGELDALAQALRTGLNHEGSIDRDVVHDSAPNRALYIVRNEP